MRGIDNGWRTFVVRTLVFSVAVFGAVRLAVARDGVAGGPARSFVTVAGTVTGLPGDPRSTTMRFTFHRTMREGGLMLCSPEVRDVPIAPGGAFAVQVPLDAMATPCPGDIFDGRDVEVDIAVGGTAVVTNAAINPVPYAHYASVAGVARQYETPDCPAGYERATDTFFTAESDRRLCQRSRMNGAMRVVYDEVVRVGRGASAFWIDRYEASVWSNETGADVQFGAGQTATDDYPASFPDNGQWTVPLYALSRTEGGISTPRIFPSRSLTWFQAQAACRTSGKRLPLGEEWLAAAHGTIDPNSNPGNPGPCRTGAGAPRQTGLARAPSVAETCISRWGAEDMIGNVSEWTADWYASVGQVTSATTSGAGELSGRRVNDNRNVWGTGFGGDGTWNVSSVVHGNTADNQMGLPSAAIRGGYWGGGEINGVFAFNLYGAPSCLTG